MDEIVGRAYNEQLSQAEILAPCGYGKGLPVFRPWGIGVVHRVLQVFVEEFACLGELYVRPANMLVPYEQYATETEDFGGYDNVYRLRVQEQDVVLRPDAALQNLRHAMDLRNAGCEASIAAVFQGMRRVKGATPPLYRDRCIWPFVQLNRIVPVVRRQKTIDTILRALTQFFDRLCLEVRIVRFGPWKQYARDLYQAILIKPSGEPTVVACFTSSATHIAAWPASRRTVRRLTLA